MGEPCPPTGAPVGRAAGQPAGLSAHASPRPKGVMSSLTCQAVVGAALALTLVRCAVPPHVLVDDELVTALEEVEERHRAVGSDDLDSPVDLDHRQPTAGSGDGVALTGVRLLAD